MQIHTINPYSGELIEVFETFTDDLLIDRLSLSQKAFRHWRNRSLEDRGELFGRLASMLRARSDVYAEMITREMGKPLREARAEVIKCAWVCEYYMQNAAKYLASENIKSDASESYISYEPLGSILAIMPWNFPFWQAFRFAAPALMAGNVCLLKPAPNTTRCGLLMEELFSNAGFPEGVMQCIMADNEQIRHIIGSSFVQAVTLTGSERAGVAVASAAGAGIKKTVLELGGSDPFIVLEDADLENAAKVAVQARMQNAGQSCIAAKRFLVAAPVAERFTELVLDEMQKLVCGDPMQATTNIGPIARPDLAAKVMQQIKKSLAKGATLLYGGDMNGNICQPTLLSGVQPGMPAFDEEIFGPVMALTTFESDAEALNLANMSDFGLGASVWTNDKRRALFFVERIESGAVFVNAMVRSDPRLPFGGIKKSGYGRELAAQGIREFCNIKTAYWA
jgi:succinate-semialdehyde dehydrogenase/glutarate-semialdehyde dehydrogenase